MTLKIDSCSHIFGFDEDYDYGCGHGYIDGNGNGYGYIHENGYGDGDGDRNGNGLGYGYGFNNGDGHGDGYEWRLRYDDKSDIDYFREVEKPKLRKFPILLIISVSLLVLPMIFWDGCTEREPKDRRWCDTTETSHGAS